MLDTDKAGPTVDLTSALKASRSNAPPPFWQTGRYSRTARRPSVLPTRLTGLEVIGLWEIKCATDTLSSKGRGSFDIEFCPKTCSSKTLVWLYYFRNCLGKVCSSNFDRDMAKRVTATAHWLLMRDHTSIELLTQLPIRCSFVHTHTGDCISNLSGDGSQRALATPNLSSSLYYPIS